MESSSIHVYTLQFKSRREQHNRLRNVQLTLLELEMKPNDIILEKKREKRSYNWFSFNPYIMSKNTNLFTVYNMAERNRKLQADRQKIYL
jgi:hypothetical protein